MTHVYECGDCGSTFTEKKHSGVSVGDTVLLDCPECGRRGVNCEVLESV